MNHYIDFLRKRFFGAYRTNPVTKVSPTLPSRKGSVVASVLAELLSGSVLNGVDMANDIQTNRLKDHISVLRKRYGWTSIESSQIAKATKDGRVQWVSQYWLPIETIDALDNKVVTQAPSVAVQIDADANNDGYINAAEKGTAITTSVTVILDKSKMVAGDVIALTNATNTKTETVTLTDADIKAGQIVSKGWELPDEGKQLTVMATAQDLAGNVSAVASDVAKLDLTAPLNNKGTLVPSGQTGWLAQKSDTGILDSDSITYDDTPTIEGAAESNAKIEVFLKDVATGQFVMDGSSKLSYVTTADSNGRYSIDVTKILPDNSSNGHGTVYLPIIKVTDGSQNSSEKDGVAFTIDKHILFNVGATEVNSAGSTKFSVNPMEDLTFKSGNWDAASSSYVYSSKTAVISGVLFEKTLSGAPASNTYVLWDIAGNWLTEDSKFPGTTVIDNVHFIA